MAAFGKIGLALLRLLLAQNGRSYPPEQSVEMPRIVTGYGYRLYWLSWSRILTVADALAAAARASSAVLPVANTTPILRFTRVTGFPKIRTSTSPSSLP